MNLARTLEASARRVPGHGAVSMRDQRWTYGEFARIVAATAGTLRARSALAPGARVAIAMENQPAFFQVLYACWQAGLCAVPMNAKLHPREFGYILENCGASACIASPTQHAGIADAIGTRSGIELIATDGAAFAALADGPAASAADVADGDPAWLFYTSGTTGRPKGAVLSHRNLLFMSQCYLSDIDWLGPTDTMIHAAPLSHGSGLYALPHIAKGSQQVIPGSGHFTPEEILALIAAHTDVTFFAAPTMLTRLMRTPAITGANLATLKTIFFGGAPMYLADLEHALEIFGPRLVQIYGQGESPMTITCMSKRDYADTTHPRYPERLLTCGSARTGVEVRIAGADGCAATPGMLGEVLTRSDCVMSGYWGNQDATASTLAGGWLHTGDVGEMDADGFLTLKDRSKDMIISGGTNIYPREIEEVLLLHAAVYEVSVVGAPHADWGEEVVAFVVSRDGAAVTEAELDGLCLDHIARFKRPKRYVFVADLPKNNYGKILKTELRERLSQEAHAHAGRS
jgi:long-chain acyl-CoA synthetase